MSAIKELILFGSNIDEVKFANSDQLKMMISDAMTVIQQKGPEYLKDLEAVLENAGFPKERASNRALFRGLNSLVDMKVSFSKEEKPWEKVANDLHRAVLEPFKLFHDEINIAFENILNPDPEDKTEGKVGKEQGNPITNEDLSEYSVGNVLDWLEDMKDIPEEDKKEKLEFKEALQGIIESVPYTTLSVIIASRKEKGVLLAIQDWYEEVHEIEAVATT